MENYNNDNSEIFGMELDPMVKSTFLEMARWTKFLSILGFIALGLMLVGGFFVGIALSKMASGNALAGVGTTGIIMIYIVIAAINFYPVYALMKYSTCMKSALNTNNKLKFNEAVHYLKNFFKYFGILAVIVLCLYGLIFIFAMIAAMASR